MTALTVASSAALAAGVLAIGTPAYAAASGCAVDRMMTPPSLKYNTGMALCRTLTGGSQVRAVVHCGSTALPPHYGPWVSRANTWSKYNCGGSEAVLVNYQTR
ncbi:hypothetical protein [Kibdelosporangium aridum]|uniref:hypothetical protein n=1 Tax=Kibdelosporangium aridum TaxID=2030 RepID=UPI0035ED36ED